GVRNRREQGADEVPMNRRAIGVEIVQTELALALYLFGVARRASASDALKPADDCVVVVRTCIDHTVADVVVREISVLRVAAESELQDTHSGQVEIISQGFNVGRDDA